MTATDRRPRIAQRAVPQDMSAQPTFKGSIRPRANIGCPEICNTQRSVEPASSRQGVRHLLEPAPASNGGVSPLFRPSLRPPVRSCLRSCACRRRAWGDCPVWASPCARLPPSSSWRPRSSPCPATRPRKGQLRSNAAAPCREKPKWFEDLIVLQRPHWRCLLTTLLAASVSIFIPSWTRSLLRIRQLQDGLAGRLPCYRRARPPHASELPSP
jgi:hypothetical protein